MNRALGTIITVLWIAAMAALVKRDMVPFWLAQTPPTQLAPAESIQIGIFDSAQRRIGTTWATTRRTPGETTVQSTTHFDESVLSSIIPGLGHVILDTTLTYGSDGGVDQFEFTLHGAPFPIRITGERYGTDFACKGQVGGMTKTLPLDARLTQYLGETLRPFTHLEGLHVGQSWRIRLLDPLALLTRQAIQFDVQLVKVTGREPIQHHDETVTCFRIETEGSIAWADDAGRVLRQEVQIPIVGPWALIDEPFDAAARAAVRAKIHHAGPTPPGT